LLVGDCLYNRAFAFPRLFPERVPIAFRMRSLQKLERIAS